MLEYDALGNSILRDKIVGNSALRGEILGNSTLGDETLGNGTSGDKILGSTILESVISECSSSRLNIEEE